MKKLNRTYQHIGAEFTLIIGDCPQGSLQKENKIEFIVVPKPSSQRHFGYNDIVKIINCIISLLYEERGGANGTQADLSISLLERPIVEAEDKYYEAERLINGLRPYMHGYVTNMHCIASADTNRFIALDIRFEFYITGQKIGDAKFQIGQSNYFLK